MFTAIRTITCHKKSFSLLNGQVFRNFGISSVQLSSLQQQFEEAKAKLNSLAEDPGNETKLKLYGLFKQSTEGSVTSKRPGLTDFVGRAKWDAWNSNGSMSQEEAQKKYIEIINSLVKTEESVEAARQESGQKYKYLLVDCDGGLTKITLNRPKKFNALLYETYVEWVDALTVAENDPKTVITAVTGAGPFFCAGNDFSVFTGINPAEIPSASEKRGEDLKRFVGTFIEFKKPLVAVVNGPAVGIGVTLLPLFDGVYASDKATFTTPFSATGQAPEGCSSLLFPRLMGFGKASQMLLFNKKLTAEEACAAGIVSEVFPDDRLDAEIWPRLKEYSKLPLKSLVYSKALIRDQEKALLHKAS
ncbi:Enoyl-CoA delta isomerase 2, mitochondrial, partial [Armadillidium vulgare]